MAEGLSPLKADGLLGYWGRLEQDRTETREKQFVTVRIINYSHKCRAIRARFTQTLVHTCPTED